ncbi:hypothetical protein LZ554_005242 [Drepanopeziza brunnea f. sp. 'monogermtubi']|nr:hypothetical protein LZ554_005242 [Drepanopeziza brunnea f. sp. 'monogermtubi']
MEERLDRSEWLVSIGVISTRYNWDDPDFDWLGMSLTGYCNMHGCFRTQCFGHASGSVSAGYRPALGSFSFRDRQTYEPALPLSVDDRILEGALRSSPPPTHPPEPGPPCRSVCTGIGWTGPDWTGVVWSDIGTGTGTATAEIRVEATYSTGIGKRRRNDKKGLEEQGDHALCHRSHQNLASHQISIGEK